MLCGKYFLLCVTSCLFFFKFKTVCGYSRYYHYVVGCPKTLIDIKDFERDLKESFFGQHIASKTVVSALAGNLHRSKYNKKPLVMCFHGSSGTGKNYLSDLIASHMFYWEKVKNLRYHVIHGRSDFPMTSQIEHYKKKLHSDVISAIKSCDTNVFVFDEVHYIPMGILDILAPILENNDVSIDSRNSIFIFLTNAGSDYIIQKSLDNLTNGFSRKNMKVEDFDTILLKSAFNEEGGLKRSSLIDSHIIDFYVPFLPLEKNHVQQCMEAELKHLEKHLDSETKSQILRMITFGPKPEKIFSTVGCKRIKAWISTKTYNN
ncbi:torsin-1A-like [Metopolophium dirhodum]|uniref:torsin-1A-like n=1 Tax=Metopolophium dirhodum TaxID=44670 RepID=UPI00298F4E32|nr:torsin-1A-like [Metopolophium dirhodum]